MYFRTFESGCRDYDTPNGALQYENLPELSLICK